MKNTARKSFQCEVCGFHYKDEETARRCETWCREHKSCNLDITKYAIENATSEK
jgi:hypothetical protein